MKINEQFLSFIASSIVIINNLCMKEERHLLTINQAEMLDNMCETVGLYFNLLTMRLDQDLEKEINDEDDDSDATGNSPIFTNN